MQNRTSIHYTLQQRVYGGFPSSVLLRNARGSRYLVQRLQKEATLTGHEGCVNSIAWNESGEYLLSGADDCHLNIYRPTERKLVQSIRSGHRANIFSAKFLPCTGDKHIVSCAGDGTIHFTDLERESTFGQFQFDCHAGTTYEVVTTPGDPNTFLSCGEDGTVRLFDLRTKTKCLCRACKEDILIDCGKPVTSINLNPIMPYHLGVGCEDSTVRVFDRRTLSHGSSNKMKGMFCQFKPESLSNKNCRVTSLHYSPDGSELLVSYCADYVYLFTLHGTKQTRSSLQDDGSENGFSTGPNGHRNVPPLKRLRLRGDWSDTGPNARPESEHPSPESSLMQRMSDMFARWLEESFRAGQRYRTRTSSSRSASLSSTASSSSISSSPSYLSGSSSESSSTSGVIVEEPRRRRSHERSAERPSGGRRGLRLGGQERKSNDASMDIDSESGLAAQENGVRTPQAEDVGPLPRPLQDGNNVSNTCTTSVELIPHCEEEDKTSGLASSDAGCAACGKNAVDQQGHKADRSATRDKKPRDTRESRTTRVPSASTASSSGVSLSAGGREIHSQKEGIVSNLATSTHANTDIASGIDRSNTDHQPNRDRIVEQAKILSACSKNADISTDVERCRSASLNSTVRDSCSGKTKVKPTVNSEALSSSHSEERPQREKKASRIARDDAHTNRTRAREDTHANRTRTERSRFTEPHASRTLGESAEESPSVSDRASAVTRIQRAYRLHKKAKSFVQDFVQHEGSDVWIPEMTRVYKGHRNSRTMIKEANFWGDGYVLSGSDCGRIFIWDKYSAELVMILQGDEHVVNCVQPHPFDPILASSGIDYDVKLWAPIAREPREPTDKEEIIRRNEKMLEESRDTITVPASFMIRMLASLNHARFGQRNPDEDTDTDSSDD